MLVRLTLTAAEDRYFVVVEDSIPAGTEVKLVKYLTRGS